MYRITWKTAFFQKFSVWFSLRPQHWNSSDEVHKWPADDGGCWLTLSPHPPWLVCSIQHCQPLYTSQPATSHHWTHWHCSQLVPLVSYQVTYVQVISKSQVLTFKPLASPKLLWSKSSKSGQVIAIAQASQAESWLRSNKSQEVCMNVFFISADAVNRRGWLVNNMMSLHSWSILYFIFKPMNTRIRLDISPGTVPYCTFWQLRILHSGIAPRRA